MWVSSYITWFNKYNFVVDIFSYQNVMKMNRLFYMLNIISAEHLCIKVITDLCLTLVKKGKSRVGIKIIKSDNL